MLIDTGRILKIFSIFILFYHAWVLLKNQILGMKTPNNGGYISCMRSIYLLVVFF